MTKEQIKQALISIVIGACTVFLVSLLEGLLDFLKAHLPNLIGGAVTALRYARKMHV